MITPLNPFSQQEKEYINRAGPARKPARTIGLVWHYYAQICQYYTDRGEAWNLEDQAQCIAAFDRMLAMLKQAEKEEQPITESVYAQEWEAFRETWTDETVKRLHDGWGNHE